MAHKRSKAAPRHKGTASGTVLASSARNPEITFTLPAAQAAFFARIGLDATRARLTAELAGWRS